MIEPRYTCGQCGWTAHPEDWPSKCVFHGSREEPPEWEAWCDSCGASWEESYEEEESDSGLEADFDTEGAPF